ncbi:DUF5988 family protein [Streptomyces spectabilis]|uniref:DUF5988 family protein n=1 Tax=Streptomyces spectabilis TaxID=68270 RepID=UPI0033D730A5
MRTRVEAEAVVEMAETEADRVLVVLRGGPGGVARTWRVAGAEVPQKVTVPYYGRHEHFERTSEVEVVDGREVPVFAWSYRTKIAE